MTEIADDSQRLLAADPLRAPILGEAIQSLSLPAGTRGLDAGCGIGLQTVLLSEAVGPAGSVTGLDASLSALVQGSRHAAQAGLSERIAFRQGDWRALPFRDGTFDWLWSADSVGYAPGDRLAEMKELVRVIKPGGLLAILFWSSQMLLPGYPALEARLNATAAGLAPFAPEMPPESHPLCTTGWLRQAGVEIIRVQTFAHTLSAPLDAVQRDTLLALLAMRWAGAEPELAAADRAAYQRLCDASSREMILDRPDYVAFFTYTLFQGRVAAPGKA